MKRQKSSNPPDFPSPDSAEDLRKVIYDMPPDPPPLPPTPEEAEDEEEREKQELFSHLMEEEIRRITDDDGDDLDLF